MFSVGLRVKLRFSEEPRVRCGVGASARAVIIPLRRGRRTGVGSVPGVGLRKSPPPQPFHRLGHAVEIRAIVGELIVVRFGRTAIGGPASETLLQRKITAVRLHLENHTEIVGPTCAGGSVERGTDHGQRTKRLRPICRGSGKAVQDSKTGAVTIDFEYGALVAGTSVKRWIASGTGHRKM